VVFGFLHLALFTTPLVSLAAARGLQGLSERGRIAAVAAAAVTGLVIVQGVVLQVFIFRDHLSRAR
jgi:hypothetical protein